MNVEELRKRARARNAILRRRKRDPRFISVVGRLVHAGLLVANYAVEPNREPLAVADALWAGEVEPRIVELLPALLVKCPALFAAEQPLPGDLAAVVSELRRDRIPSDFRGISGTTVHRWLSRVGRKGKVPSLLKSFRLTPEDQRLLQRLKETLDVSETEVIRRGLRALVPH